MNIWAIIIFGTLFTVTFIVSIVKMIAKRREKNEVKSN